MRLSKPIARAFSTINHASFFSRASKSREPSAIRSLMPLLKIPGMISLGGGNPNTSLFPFAGLQFTLKDGQKVELTKAEVEEALQYSATPGLPKLLEFLHKFQMDEHKPPLKGSDVAVCTSVGGQDSLSKSFEMLLNPGDPILVENPTYSGALAFLRPYLGNKNCLIPVNTDHEGLVPENLERAILASNPRPRVLYTIPHGCNPSGATLSQQRRKEIYALAQKYNLIVLEDDPYYFLHFGEKAAPKQDADFTRPRLNSLFSLDTDGRVIRFDSFSKVLSAGFRLGFATGHKNLINQLGLHTQATNLHASGVSQALIQKLLCDTWGAKGFLKHLDKVALFYARRRDAFLSLADKHLTGLCEWRTPSAGMFVWMKVLGVEDTQELIQKKAIDAKVILLHGQAFSPRNEKSNFVRAAYSTATDKQIDTALSRFASLLKH